MLGVGIPWNNAETDPDYYRHVLTLLQPPKWYNWKHDRLGDEGYVPMCWRFALGTALDKAIAAAKAKPGHLWLAGNEPELDPVHGQSDTSPSEYAQAAKRWMSQVGGKWGGPGILWHEQGRQWVRNYLALNAPLPSVWTIHLYGTSSVQQWEEQYAQAKGFFAGLGISRPVWVTETAAHGNVDVQRALMERLMRRGDGVTSFWYSAHDPFGPWRTSDLVNKSGTQTTALGYRYGSYQREQQEGDEGTVYMPIARS